MYIFHALKPNYFLTEDVKVTNRSYSPSRIGQKINNLNLLLLPKDKAISMIKFVSSKLQTGDETKWNDNLWSTVYDAEKVYQKVNQSRQQAILDKLSHDLFQSEDSFVVEGAVLTCPYCTGIGSLENIESHGHVIIIIKDRKE